MRHPRKRSHSTGTAYVMDAHTEGQFGFGLRRLYPRPLGSAEAASLRGTFLTGRDMLTQRERIMLEWYRLKCVDDEAWCHG